MLVVPIVLGAAATVLAYGTPEMMSSFGAVAATAASSTSEPTAMLISGSALLAVAGVLKKYFHV
jgi:hypothetical protein